MALDNFDSELLKKLQSEKLQPRPRWQFLLKDYVIWGFGAFSLALGALSTSLILYLSPADDFGIYGRIEHSSLANLLMILPVFWIVCLAAFSLLVYYNIKHTKRGYRYSPIYILVGIIISSFVLGAVFNRLGAGRQIDNLLGRHAPFYGEFLNPGLRFWSDPEGGRLTGLIIGHPSRDEFTLVDMEESEWRVLTEGIHPNGAPILIGQPIRLLGQIEGKHVFKASEVLPSGPGGGFFERLRGHRPPPSDVRGPDDRRQ